MNQGSMNGAAPAVKYRYRRRDIPLKGVPVTLATWTDLIAACVRTGHAEDAMLLRIVRRNQQAYADQLALHGRLECAIADYVQALTAGQAERAAALRAALTAAGAVLTVGEDGAVDWVNPVLGGDAAAPLLDGPMQHALQATLQVRIE